MHSEQSACYGSLEDQVFCFVDKRIFEFRSSFGSEPYIDFGWGWKAEGSSVYIISWEQGLWSSQSPFLWLLSCPPTHQGTDSKDCIPSGGVYRKLGQVGFPSELRGSRLLIHPAPVFAGSSVCISFLVCLHTACWSYLLYVVSLRLWCYFLFEHMRVLVFGFWKCKLIER